MKRFIAISLVLILAIGALAACNGNDDGSSPAGKGKDGVYTYVGEDSSFTISLKYPKTKAYRWSTDAADLKVHTLHGAIITEDFTISIGTFNLSWHNCSYNAYQRDLRDIYESARDVTFGGLKGTMFYYEDASSYRIALPIGKEGFVNYATDIWVSCPSDDRDTLDEVMGSDAVRGILDSVEVVVY